MKELGIGIVGAGAIGRTHIAAIRAVDAVDLCGIVEPHQETAQKLKGEGLPVCADLDALIASRPVGVIVAVPNDLHLPVATALLHAGIAVLVEKPLADTSAHARQIFETSQKCGVPGLVGHHRRYNPIIRAARSVVTSGDFGDLVSGNVSYCVYKPEDYFMPDWRRSAEAGGPLLINLIHEIDLLHFLFGPITQVAALTSNARRHFAVEDTAGAVLRFASGGIVCATATDAAVGPWCWDITAGENLARFPAHDAVSHSFSGTRRGFSLPDMKVWTHDGAPDWTKKMSSSVTLVGHEDAYERQILHFADVIAGKADPIASLEDGLANVTIIEAIKAAAQENRVIDIDAPQTLSPPDSVANGGLF
ncbi:Gfo/Idh/MocA family protein [Mariluticola halotolerans]|uniref:Gfo/Idh/MocA family protein n=1 Tax=Mariluticola halotolerans TaxID=2909283 RepID=UPI0026E264D4|nr:Gfo/Idh/MocA family oxidoreductase [Mariluticola halotolerans]UJQ94109.1 Gfo/Idh/MocA family oxidoreductase [Mariluticola halotolerans]